MGIDACLQCNKCAVLVDGERHAGRFMKKVLPLKKTQQKVFPVFPGKRGNAAGDQKFFRTWEVMKQDEKIIDGEGNLIVSIAFQGVRTEFLHEKLVKKIKRACHENLRDIYEACESCSSRPARQKGDACRSVFFR